MSRSAFCPTCESIQEVETSDSGDNLVFCCNCGEEFPYQEGKSSGEGKEGADSSKYANYKIGIIQKVENIPKSKDLKLAFIDIYGDGRKDNFLPVVTNAKYCEAGWRVIVACIGAIVPAGATISAAAAASGGEDDGVIRVAKRQVQGVESQGMICDCQMLGWTGGAKGFIQQLPESFKIGDPIPDSRPRV